MSERRIDERWKKVGHALERFSEALAMPENELVVDAAIQRFEFTFELLWKALKADLEDKGRAAGGTPKGVLRTAYQAGWLQEEEPWLAMLKDRNLTSHTYNEVFAKEVFARLPRHRDLIEGLYGRRDELD